MAANSPRAVRWPSSGRASPRNAPGRFPPGAKMLHSASDGASLPGKAGITKAPFDHCGLLVPDQPCVQFQGNLLDMVKVDESEQLAFSSFDVQDQEGGIDAAN